MNRKKGTEEGGGEKVRTVSGRGGGGGAETGCPRGVWGGRETVVSGLIGLEGVIVFQWVC